MRCPLPRLSVSSVLLLLLFCTPAQAQQTFTVTVGDKTSSHPSAGEGFAAAFYIDGEEARALTLTRGTTYTFQMDDVPAIHPFYLTTSAVGAGAAPYDEGVTGQGATGTATLTFTPTAATPDDLFYQCLNHEYMGWRITVQDAAPEHQVGLRPVAQGLVSPIALTYAPDDSGRLFIVDQVGLIRVLMPDGTLRETPFLDLRDRIVDLMAGFDERGLLGLAFHPDYAANGRFFVYYSAPLRASAPPDWDNTSTIAEFTVSDSDPHQADPTSERILLEVDQPQFNHAGGTLAFGPEDGFLYISLGDGGGARDVGTGHVADWYAANDGGNAQDVMANLLGSILRIDVDGGTPYGIPADNPFLGREGRDEIYAYGLRNPYRFSFDMGGALGLLAGDAGQNRWEEVDLIENGGNYGWNVKEGTHCFDAANPNQDRATCPTVVGAGHPDAGDPLIDPVIEYPNINQDGGLGLVVVGGYVYRGTALPDFEGRYLFGDYSTDPQQPRGLLFAATPQAQAPWPFDQLTIASSDDGAVGRFVLGFGQDPAGEVYVLTSDTPGPTGTGGEVLKIVPPDAGTARTSPDELPTTAALAQNYPNPFNPRTTIRFRTAQAGPVRLAVYDVRGRRIATLVDREAAPGAYTVTWDGTTDAGRPVASGIYLYRLDTSTTTEVNAMTLVK